MTDAMSHRGPSDRGTYVADGVALGARRLSIIDVEAGHQPFSNEDQTVWAAQNGEIYNHDTLRRALEASGHRMVSRCDTEVIPHVYEREGVGFAGSLTGKFAIVVWDGKRRRAVLARDRLGIKPLYYSQIGDRVAFASELKSLLASGLVDTTLDLEGIAAYLHFGFFPAPHTPLIGVRKLLPGHQLIIDPDGVREEAYWHFPQPEEDKSMTEREAGERLMSELETAVVRRLMSDVPIGAMLSGGLDSSLIVGLMARNMSEPVKTFSVAFADSGRNNELGDAKLVSNHFGTDHHELQLSFADQPVSIEELAWWMDEPLVDLGALGFLSLSKLAADRVTVALSGQGADELFGGYSRYLRASLVGRSRSMPRPLVAGSAALLSLAGGRYQRFAGALRAPGATERHLALRGPWVSRDLAHQLADARLRGMLESAPLASVGKYAAGLTDDPLPASMYLDSQLTLVDDMVHYFDRASMAHSLEVRMPFLDHHVVELSARIPSRLKVNGLTTKYLVKNISRGLVPDQIIDKRKIGFFSGNARQWVGQQLRGSASNYLLEGQLASAPCLDVSAVRRLAANFETGGPTGLDALFAILMLEVWLKSVLPRATSRPEPERELIRFSP